MRRFIKYKLILAFLAGFIGTSCENNDINVDAGTFPETDGIGTSIGVLQSDNYVMKNPLIHMDHASLDDGFHIRFTEPAIQPGSYTVKIDESKVTDFNTKHGTNYSLYPARLASIGNNGKLTIEKGKQQSNSITVSFTFDNSIETSTIYLLPLTVEEDSNSPAVSKERNTLYYIINVWGDAPAEYVEKEKNYIQIAGIDPEFTNPLLINKLYMESLSLDEEAPLPDYYNPFDIVNLHSATVRLDENHLPYLYLKDDLAYVLDKREKYIVPLQQLNHKVYLSIKGGGEGIGFSNMGEKEMKIFVERTKQIIDLYHLDGINLYDAGFAYKTTDNQSDYSKNLCILISSFKKALKTGEHITYTQTAESPKGITDNSAELKLGELVQYAWTDKLNTIVDPWSAPEEWTSPIAGLSKEKWGALNTDIHISSEEKGILDLILDPFIQPSPMIEAGINHVFVVNRIDYVTAGLEPYAPSYMGFGAICNLCNSDELYFVTGDINSPNQNQYLNIHNRLIPKDY